MSFADVVMIIVRVLVAILGLVAASFGLGIGFEMIKESVMGIVVGMGVLVLFVVTGVTLVWVSFQ